MAVYTEVTDAALMAFLQDYDLGQVLSFKGIAGGVENTNYALHTQKGQFILTLYEKRVAEADLPFFIGLMDHLAATGFPCPQPVRNRQGQALARLANRPAAMVTFLDGLDVKQPGADLCEEAGRAMARLHLAAQGFAITRVNTLAPHGWPALVEAGRAGANGVEPGLERLITTSWPPSNRPGRPAFQRVSSTPTCFPTTCFSSTANCPASSISTSPATITWPTTSPSR